MVGVNPETGHEQMANLNYTHGIAQALWQGKLFHIDLNGQNGPKFDQDLIFGHGNLLNAFSIGRPAGERRTRAAGRRTTGRGTSTTSRCAPRTSPGSGTSAAANMRTYLILKQRAAEFRADPEVQEALAAAKVAELWQPTLTEGETYDRPARRPVGVGGLRRRRGRRARARVRPARTSWLSSTSPARADAWRIGAQDAEMTTQTETDGNSFTRAVEAVRAGADPDEARAGFSSS